MTIYEIKYARATATARRLFAPVSHLPPQSRSQRLRPTINFFDYGTLRATWGSNNTNSGYYSAILGGSGNVIMANRPYAGIFGCNIGAGACAICVQPHTFHVECLQACATPLHNIFPKGTISYWPAPAGMGFPTGSCVAMIS